MPEGTAVFKQEVKYKGFFDYSKLYDFCYNWLVDENYEVFEDEYSEKLSGEAKEVKIRWTAKKKISDYFRNLIKIEWHIIGMEKVEVQQNGKRQKMNKGDLKIKVSADLERDYEKKWEDNPFLKFLRGIYDRYIIRTTAEEYEGRLKGEANEFVEQLKSFLVLEGKK